MIQSDTDDTSSEGSFEMLCSTSVLSMVQEEEEGESLSEQLERLLAKYEDPDAQDATFENGVVFSLSLRELVGLS